MSEARRFLFDTSFDSARDRDPGAEGEEAAEAPVFTEAELEQARAASLASGRESGFREAAASIEQSIARSLETIAGQIAELEKTLGQDGRRRDNEALEAAMAVLRKLFPGLAARHGLSEVETLVGECLERVREEPRVVIRVADPLLDSLRDRLDALSQSAGFEGRIVLLAEDALGVGDARVEWADGGAERDTAGVWRRVEDILAHAALESDCDSVE
jgi:flagellar assembly protein FliH